MLRPADLQQSVLRPPPWLRNELRSCASGLRLAFGWNEEHTEACKETEAAQQYRCWFRNCRAIHRHGTAARSTAWPELPICAWNVTSPPLGIPVPAKKLWSPFQVVVNASTGSAFPFPRPQQVPAPGLHRKNVSPVFRRSPAN